MSNKHHFGYYSGVVEISKTFFLNVYDLIWWKFCPGLTITVKWPHDEYSSDPNYFYRPYLEENIGNQGVDWNWRMGVWEDNTLLIKLRLGKEKWASHLVILWS